MMIERWTYEAEVLDVYEFREAVGGKKTGAGDKDSELIYESRGWFARIHKYYSISLGTTKPELKKGDIVIVTIQTKRTENVGQHPSPKVPT